VENFRIIAFTHKSTELSDIGRLHIEDSLLNERLSSLRSAMALGELMYLSTCNRVEFLTVTETVIEPGFLKEFFSKAYPSWSKEEIHWAIESAQIFSGEEALEHLFSVASSIDSLVVGEREIITQVRNAYERCNEFGITGDLIRLIIKRTIETAKDVYTHTHIAQKPVSVVSLAYRKLRELNVKLDSRILVIGAGVTNSSMCKYLKKHGFKNFTIFNRTLSNAEKLAKELNGKAFALAELEKYSGGFDVLLTCTGSEGIIVTKEIYKSLAGSDKSKKIVIDLAIPNDLDPEILRDFDVNLIAINNLQSVAKENMQEREKELESCYKIIAKSVNDFRQILKTRKVELAMSEVPRKVREIRETAINSVFAKEFEGLDEHSKEVFEKMLSYIEKKYISVPMKMAKEILIK
jgi:glutamyl-tRNA reductase